MKNKTEKEIEKVRTEITELQAQIKEIRDKERKLRSSLFPDYKGKYIMFSDFGGCRKVYMYVTDQEYTEGDSVLTGCSFDYTLTMKYSSFYLNTSYELYLGKCTDIKEISKEEFLKKYETTFKNFYGSFGRLIEKDETKNSKEEIKENSNPETLENSAQ